MDSPARVTILILKINIVTRCAILPKSREQKKSICPILPCSNSIIVWRFQIRIVPLLYQKVRYDLRNCRNLSKSSVILLASSILYSQKKTWEIKERNQYGKYGPGDPYFIGTAAYWKLWSGNSLYKFGTFT